MQSGHTPKRSLLGLLIGMAAIPLAAHAIEIEQRPLSSTPSQVIAPAPVQAAPVTQPARPLPAASTPARAAAPVNPAWDMFQQLESLQATVATLQGQVEEQQQLIERMREDLRVRYTDLDQRIELLGNNRTEPSQAAANAVTATATGVAADAVPPNDAAPVTPPAPPAAAGIPVPMVEKPVEKPAAPVIAATTTAAAAATSTTTVPATGNDSAADIETQKQAYLAAYQRFRADGAPAAITAMQSFIKAYPNSVFAPNAHYWLGEFQLAREPANYQAAETSFNRVIRDYEGSPKVASAYYKLGTIADLRGQRNEARRWMQDVVAKFAGSPEARLAQAYLDQNPAGVAPASGTR